MMRRIAMVSLAFLVAAGALLAGGCSKKDGKQPIHCYASEIMYYPMVKIAKLYEKQTGKKVEMDTADCGDLMIRIQTQQTGDVYISHDPFCEMLMSKGLGVQAWNLAVLTPVIIVRKGNPKHIESVRDLARPGLKLGMTDPEHSSAGHIDPVIFKKAGLTKQIEKNIVKRSRMGGTVANWVAMGDVDAVITWNAVAHYDRKYVDEVPIDPEYRPIPGVDIVTSATHKVYDVGQIKVTIATLKCSKMPAEAKKFAEFAEAHRDVFVKEYGYSPAPPKQATGTITVDCGAGLRPAMQDAVNIFEGESRAKVETNYQGSGTLLSSIIMKKQSDLYMPGDAAYLDMLNAKDNSVLARKDIAWFVPQIIVAKGNPKHIQSLADLAKPGMKLALGNASACQIGRLTEQLFKKNHIDLAAIKANTTHSTMTVNSLGVEVQTGTVDAAIVWDAIAHQFASDVDIVKIPPEQNIFSHVAIGLLKYSQNKPLAKRFMEWLAGPQGQNVFLQHHYTIKAPAGAP